MTERSRSRSFRLSLSALMAALGAVLMLCGNLIPILTYAAPMLSSLTLLPILREFGKKYAWMTWGVTALLALLLCTDRESAFFYLFVGWYPIMKPSLDRIRARPVRILVKLVLFTAVFLLLFALLTFVMGLEDMRSEILLSLVVYALLVLSMLLFERVYDRAALIYDRRLRDKLLRRLPGP